MRRYPTDKPLWAIFSLSIFVALGFVDPILGSTDTSLWHRAMTLFTDKWREPSSGFIAVGFSAVVVAVPSVILGWPFHAVAVMCGLRLSRLPDPQPVIDYEDDGQH